MVWDHGGPPRNIGDFGGVAWNTPMAVNEQGAVVGFANASAASGADLDPRAFIWTESGGIRPLDALPGDVTSQATGINEWGQVVGQSCDADGNCHGVLWQNGIPANLNDLVVSGDVTNITTANDIDDFGRITGQGVDSTGKFVAFLATPDVPLSDIGYGPERQVSLRPEPLRRALRCAVHGLSQAVGDPEVRRRQGPPRPPALREVAERRGRARSPAGEGAAEGQIAGRTRVWLAEPQGEVVRRPGAEAVERGDRRDEPVEADAAVEHDRVLDDRTGEQADRPRARRREAEAVEVAAREHGRGRERVRQPERLEARHPLAESGHEPAGDRVRAGEA